MSIERKNISRRSKEAEENRKEKWKRPPRTFGSKGIEEYESGEKRDHLELDKKWMIRMLTSEDRSAKYEAESLIQEYFVDEDNEQFPEFSDIPKEKMMHIPTLNKLYDELNDGTRELSDESFIKLLKPYQEKMARVREILKEDLEEMRRNFVYKGIEAVREGWLPLEEGEFAKRAIEAPITIRDMFDSTLTKSPASHSDYRGIEVSNLQTKDQVQRSVMHELMHSVSGMHLEKSEGSTHVSEKRVGFSMDKKGKSRLVWLNEAMTERMTKKLLGEDPGATTKDDGYVFEQKKLQEMIDAGVPEEMFANAYFENRDPDNTQPEARKLYRKITEVMGKGHLVKVEKESKKRV